MLYTKYITEDFAKTMKAEFPEAFKDKHARAFLMFLCFGNFTGSKWENPERYLLLPQFVCAALEDKLPAFKNNKYTSKPFLDRMKKFIPYEYDEYISTIRCRRVANKGFSEEFNKKLQECKEEMLKTPKNKLVHYFRGTVKNEHAKIKEEKNELLISEILNSKCKTIVEVQKSFLEYLNGLSSHTFTGMVKNNWDHMMDVFNEMEFADEATRERTILIMNAIKEQPKPIYHAVNSSYRLYANPGAITYLPSKLRAALMRGSIEFDIVSCHLAIVAKDWEIPSLTRLLKETTVWDYLEDFLEGASTAGKPVIKEAIYAIVYGDSKHNITMRLKKGKGKARGLTQKQVEIFYNAPVIKDLFEARDKQIKAAVVDLKDCYGNTLELRTVNGDRDKNGPMRTLISQKAQAVEMKMLEPVLEFSKNNRDYFLITLYQFDGFSCHSSYKDRTESKCNELKKLLDDNIKTMGYDTEVKYEIK